MNIMEISAIQDPAIMKIKVLQLAKEKNCTEDDIWDMIENFRRTHEEGKAPNMPGNISPILKKILSRVKIRNESAGDMLANALTSHKISFNRDSIEGKYGVDFVIGDLIIDIDKRKYILSSKERDDDFNRQFYLIRKGYTVMKLTSNEILIGVDNCVDKIKVILGK